MSGQLLLKIVQHNLQLRVTGNGRCRRLFFGCSDARISIAPPSPIQIQLLQVRRLYVQLLIRDNAPLIVLGHFLGAMNIPATGTIKAGSREF